MDTIIKAVKLHEKATLCFTEFIDIAEAVKDGLRELELSEDVIADIEDVFTVFDYKQVDTLAFLLACPNDMAHLLPACS
jgi:hypothetical protein